MVGGLHFVKLVRGMIRGSAIGSNQKAKEIIGALFFTVVGWFIPILFE